MAQKGPKGTEVEDGTPAQRPIRAPRGFHAARIDEKGRLKFPTNFQEYLNSLDDKVLFVTTMGRGIVRVYPNSLWEQNEKFFNEQTEDPKAAQRLAFMANAYGGDVQMDTQGRVLLPAKLRQTLELENSAVQLLIYRERIDIYKQSMFDEQMKEAEAAIDGDLDLLERNGLR